MTAPYVPQVGDRVRRCDDPGIDEWIDIEHIARGWTFGFSDNGDPVATNDPGPWVKVDKPEPWPVEYWLIRRKNRDDIVSIERDGPWDNCDWATAFLRRCWPEWPPADLRIWRSNPDGSVTVLDHTGSEL